MRNGTRLLAGLIMALCLMVPMIVAASHDAESDGTGTDETRSVPGYGYDGDDFTNPAYTTVYGSSEVRDDNLTLNDVYLDTDFNDGTLQGWEVVKEIVEATNGHMRTNTGTARYNVSIDNFTIDLDLMMAILDVHGNSEGFQLSFTGNSQQFLYVMYENKNDTLFYEGTNDRIHFISDNCPFNPIINKWYHIRIDHLNGYFNVTINGQLIFEVVSYLFDDVSQIRFSTYWGDIYYDNILIRTDDGHGHAVTGNVTLPYNRLWDRVEVNKTENPLGTVRFSVLRPYADRIFPKHDNITDSTRDITDILVSDTDKLYLVFWLDGIDRNWPSVDWWRIYWRPDPPRQYYDIPQVRLREDEPLERALDLSRYFADTYTATRDLVFAVSHMSDPSHVRAVVEGYNLSIELPTKDWYGTETVKVNCSDGEFVTESANITVVVTPVNDPPVLSLPDSFEAMEGADSVLNLTDYITDPDTPLGMMKVEEDSSNCTVSGLELHFWYTVGSVTDQVLVSVSDREFSVDATLNVTVANVNDAPFIVSVPVQEVVEEAPYELDLSPYLSDEDNATADLRVTSSDPNVSSVDGRVLTILFAEASEPTTVSFSVTDGLATVSGFVPVRVEPVNDPPVVLTVGGMDASAQVVLRLSEGEEGLYEIVIGDVDSLGASFSVDSDLDGVAIYPNGTLRVTTVRGDVGTYLALITVDDLDGGITELNVTIEVTNVNDPPSIPDILSPANGTVVEEGTNVTFEARYTDLDTALGQVLNVVWRSNVSGELRRLTSDDAAFFTSSGLAPGRHLITVTVSDGEFERSASMTLIIKAKQVIGPNGADGDGETILSSIGWIGVILIIIVVSAIIILVISYTKRSMIFKKWKYRD